MESKLDAVLISFLVADNDKVTSALSTDDLLPLDLSSLTSNAESTKRFVLAPELGLKSITATLKLQIPDLERAV